MEARKPDREEDEEGAVEEGLGGTGEGLTGKPDEEGCGGPAVEEGIKRSTSFQSPSSNERDRVELLSRRSLCRIPYRE